MDLEVLTKDKLKLLSKEVFSCKKCARLYPLRKIASLGFGNFNSKIMMIAQNPGIPLEREFGLDYGDVLKNSKMGKYLTKVLHVADLTWKDIYYTNICKCPSPNNSIINENEIKNCSEYLIQQINELQPKIIITLGKIAENNLPRSCKLLFTTYNWYHPAYLWRKSTDEHRAILKSYIRDLKGIL